jgi:hypothetical protein
MTTGYNDRTCTNGKGGIKSVILFPLGNVTSSNITANEVDTLTVSGEVFVYKLKSNLSKLYCSNISQQRQWNSVLYSDIDNDLGIRYKRIEIRDSSLGSE